MRASTIRPLFALARDKSGLALMEFGLALPILLLVCLTGLEETNWIMTKMQVSQVALQIADNASRMGDAVQGIKVVSEDNISEVFTGGNLQAGSLNLSTNSRVILSSLEPVANPNTTGKFKIQWQRCFGAPQSKVSDYGPEGTTDLSGIGPAARMVKAQDGDATMFVELFYRYTPLFSASIVPSTTISESASMTVRDARKLGGPPTSTGTAATC